MIISASRRTDVPAFYSEWFINRIKEGYLIVRNPMNRQLSRIILAPDIVDCIVFWTKNPKPMLPMLDLLKDYCFYFQFTLTGYGSDIEKNLPDKREILIPVFQELSKKIGSDKVIWRYDPIMINDRYTVEYHLKSIEKISAALKGYTEKCVFSFVDIYKKNSKALSDLGVKELSQVEMMRISAAIRDVTSKYGIMCATCSERIDLSALGIEHNACIDRALIEHLTHGSIKSTKGILKDAGQRPDCGCMASKEIGTNNTCRNGCVYCYANYSAASVAENAALYDPLSPILCDTIGPDETIKDATDMKSLIDRQLSISDLL